MYSLILLIASKKKGLVSNLAPFSISCRLTDVSPFCFLSYFYRFNTYTDPEYFSKNPSLVFKYFHPVQPKMSSSHYVLSHSVCSQFFLFISILLLIIALHRMVLNRRCTKCCIVCRSRNSRRFPSNLSSVNVASVVCVCWGRNPCLLKESCL